MANLISVRLNKGDSSSWGFRLQGGKDFGTPLIIQKINSGSPAERAGLISGDAVIRINNVDVFNLRHKDAQDVILRAGPSIEIAVQRGGLTWKPDVSPVGRVTSPRPTQSVNSLSPVTATSLAAGRHENIGAIGTSHNNAAKPFSAVNGGPHLVNKQYNSPVNLYSEQSIAETLSAQSEVLSNGVVGVNFKKNEKSYDSTNSAVFRMVQEADKEPRDYYEPEVDTSPGVVTSPIPIAGLRHVHAPENKPTPPPQPLPPGQNICADCERLIVGVFVRIKDKNLHVECFKCATCGSSLKNAGYYNLNNKLYCDVHAKLAAINNPPATNLVPVTVQPGGKLPSGTISAALSSHTLPSPSALSPNSNYTPVYQPARPYSSGISAPISPTNSLPKYSTSPVTAQPETRCVQNTVWPPLPKEPELPTASPLYFPPPSQVHIPQKPQKTEEQEFSEPDDVSYRTPFGSVEMLNITRGMLESYETVSDSIETQMLVDSVLKTSQSHETTNTKPGDVAVSFTISESDLRKGGCSEVCQKVFKESEKKSFEISKSNVSLKTDICVQEEYENKTCLKQEHPQSIATIYEKAIKVENSVPHKWESPMLVALTTASDRPYSPIPSEPDAFLPPPKRATSALGAALAVAPAEPFTPAPRTSLEPIPLPEYTEPYCPPEHPIVIEPKEPKEEDEYLEPKSATKEMSNKKASLNKYRKKPIPDTDEYLKDLPKPATKISMLSALTTAPTRPYSPFAPGERELIKPEDCDPEPAPVEEVVEIPQTPEPPVVKQKVFPKPEPCAAVFTAPERLFSPFTANKVSYETQSQLVATEKSEKNTLSEEHSTEIHKTRNTQCTENVTNVSTGCPPLIHCIRSSFETKTDKVHMEMSCAFPPNEPVTTKRIVEKKTDVTEQQVVSDKKFSEQQLLQEEKTLKDIQIVKTVDKPISVVATNPQVVQYVKPLQTRVTEKTEQVDVSQEATRNITESTLIQQACSRIHNTSQTTPKQELAVIQTRQAKLIVPEIAFQPVNEDVSCNNTFSPRPRSVTPSMINKPASVLPYYQANLVAVQQPPAAGSIYDPKSPAPSRSPSPYPGAPSSSQPHTVRAVSPAPGPPPNPLKSSTPIATIIHDGKVDQARDFVQTYIPQHRTANVASSVYETTSFQQSGVREAKSSCAGAMTNQICTIRNGSNVQCSPGQVYEKTNTCKEVVQVSGDNVIQVQRKKVVTHEYERNQNSVQVEKRSGSSQTHVTEVGNDVGVLGMHVTNPQPLRSPFIQGEKDTKTNITQGSAAPRSIPKAIKAPPAPSNSSNVNVKPNESQPNAGTGGGRQTGAVGVAPKRGRGVLNLAATPGSRVPLCGHCHTNIRGPFITALGKIWCPEHFTCATPSCRRALQDLGFVEEQGQLYCEFCFEKYLAPLCAKCGVKVKGDCLKAIGKTFHPECFNCAYCGKLFGNSPFFLEDGQPYCENDWNELFTTKCFACGYPVEAGDRWVEALNNNYHSQCFNCTMCKKNLEGQSFFAKGGRPFCKNHAR